MRLFFKICLIILLVGACFIQATGKDKDVILCLDESGSMSGEKFNTLVYAIQLTASLLDETDRLYIIRGGGSQTIEINLNYKKKEIDTKIKQSIRTANGASECPVMNPAYQLMQKDIHREKIMILFGDGRWGTCGVEVNIVNDFKRIKPKIIFFKIENSSSLNSISQLERNFGTLPTSGFQVFRNPSDNMATVKENLFKLSKSLIDADPSKIKHAISGNKLEFQSKFPLKKLLFIVQKDNCALTATSLSIKEDIEMTNNQMGGSLRGRYYEIATTDKSILPANKKIYFTLNCAINPREVDVIPIVAMDLKTEVVGNFIKTNLSKKEYTICDKEQEVRIQVSLIDDKGAKLPMKGLSDLKLLASNGIKEYPLSISGTSAIGTIKVPNARTYLTVEAQYEGYFQKKSRIITIRKESCPLKLAVQIAGEIKEQDATGQRIEVCQQVTELAVTTIIQDDKNLQQAFASLGTVNIEVHTKKGGNKLKNQMESASGKLPLTEDRTEATFKLLVNGQVLFESPVYTITKVHCGPIIDSTAMDFGEIPVMEFAQNGRCMERISLSIIGTTTIVSPKNYSLQIKGVPREFEVTIDTLGQYFKVCFHKKAFLCDCFLRHGTFGGTVIATPKKEGTFIGIEKQWELTILPEAHFFIRCKTCLLLALFTGASLWYLYGIITKARFHRSARFHFVEEDRSRRYGSNPEDEFWLKTNSFVKRYLVPYLPEQKIIGDDNLLIIASGRKDVVYLSKKSFLSKMKVNGAKMDEDNKKDETIGEKDMIRIGKSNSVSVKYTFLVN